MTNEPRRLKLPLSDKDIMSLKIGDRVLLSGKILTGRDAAHKRFINALDKGEELPVNIEGQTIYYVGPCPAPQGCPIGSCGPTTSGRMDAYAPRLISLGLKTMIGKGKRSKEVIDALRTYKGVYFLAAGGAGALLAGCVRSAKVLVYPELLSEAVHELEIEDMPVIVGIDACGRDIFTEGQRQWRRV